jgi:hypothetical protein
MAKAIRRNFQLILILFVIFCQTIYPAVIEVSLDELVNQTSLIIKGSVENIECTWDKEHKFIYSYVKIGVSGLIKGELDKKEIIVKHLGGQVGNLGFWVSVAPHFENYEEVIVLLGKKDSSDNYEIPAQKLGKFTIQNDKVKEIELPVQILLNRIETIISRQKPCPIPQK